MKQSGRILQDSVEDWLNQELSRQERAIMSTYYVTLDINGHCEGRYVQAESFVEAEHAALLRVGKTDYASIRCIEHLSESREAS